MLYIVLLAAGSSERFGKKSKIFTDLAGKPVFLHSLEKFLELKREEKIVLVVKKNTEKKVKKILKKEDLLSKVTLIVGGKTRQESVFNGFKHIKSVETRHWHVSTDFILIHNCANPLVTEKEILDCLKMAKKYGVCGVGHKINDTVRRQNPSQPPLKKGGVARIIDRKNLYLMQTPQIVRMDIFEKAYECAKKIKFEGTDDLAVVENLMKSRQWSAISGQKFSIQIAPASRQNFKITTKEDLEMAKKVMRTENRELSNTKKYKSKNLSSIPQSCGTVLSSQIGIGEDAHLFEKIENEKCKIKNSLTLGGMKFQNYPKLQANSDGDVMIHSLCNAISSVLGEKSLGSFADKMCLEEKIVDSKEFLKPLLAKLKKQKLKIQSVSFSLECLVPKIDPISDKLKISISKILKISKDKIGITATTGNQTTIFGAGKGVRCACVVLLLDK